MGNRKIWFGVFCIAFACLVGGCNKKSQKRYKEIEFKVEQKSEDVVFGNDTASHTIFLYASYNCKFCRYLFKKTFPGLKEKYLDKGLIKVVIKWVDFAEDPLTLYALKAGSCIYRYGSYDKFHELLLTNPSVIASDDFRALVDDIMAENYEIAQCVLADNNYSYLKSNVQEFRDNNLHGTPCMVINNHAYGGYFPFKILDEIVKREFKF